METWLRRRETPSRWRRPSWQIKKLVRPTATMAALGGKWREYSWRDEGGVHRPSFCIAAAESPTRARCCGGAGDESHETSERGKDAEETTADTGRPSAERNCMQSRLSANCGVVVWPASEGAWLPRGRTGGSLDGNAKRRIAGGDGKLPPTRADFEWATTRAACLRTDWVASNGLPVCQAPGQATNGPRFARHRGKG